MQRFTHASLKKYHTFGINCFAREIIEVDQQDELSSLLVEQHRLGQLPLILGGGSNVLFTKDVDNTVIVNRLIGIERIREDDHHVWVRVGAGEVWHQFVLWCIRQNLSGVENLSLIPGSVGAAPMQNIGAYGVELKAVFDSLEAIERSSGKLHTFTNTDCEFGYRSSIFKTHAKNQFVITSVMFRLNKVPQFNTSYGAIEQELEYLGVTELSIQAISEAVIRIRERKLPNPAEIGNAGSFFKNPVIPVEEYELLQKTHADIPGYPAGEGMKKVAAGWLIDQAGWKGKTFDNYGVHKKQALVLVNYGDAQGQQIYDLSESIVEDIASKYGITLEREVNII